MTVTKNKDEALANTSVLPFPKQVGPGIWVSRSLGSPPHPPLDVHCQDLSPTTCDVHPIAVGFSPGKNAVTLIPTAGRQRGHLD